MGRGRHLEHVIMSERTLAASPTRGLLGWDARVKVGFLVLVIVLNTWVAIPWLSGVLLGVGLALLLWTRLPWRQMWPFLVVPLLPATLVLVGFALGFGETPLARLGPATLHAEGLLRGGQVVLRAYCDILWLIGLVLSTPMAAVFDALRWYRVPGILVDTLAMMYRYIFVLYGEYRRMRLASQSRGGRSGYRTEMASLSRIAAQIFLRAFDRSERIYWAMVARGGQRND